MPVIIISDLFFIDASLRVCPFFWVKAAMGCESDWQQNIDNELSISLNGQSGTLATVFIGN
jgi:hypothetical protein